MRYLDQLFPTLAENLALDEALLLAAEHDGQGPVLRLWESPNVAVVLGASGRLADDVNFEACLSDGVPIGRRSSGGGTVVLGPGALNAAVVLPIADAPELSAVDSAQCYVLRKIAESLKSAGRNVQIQGSGDLTVGARKVSGSAQRRLRRHVLVHATILYAFPIEAITRYTNAPLRQPSYRQQRPHDQFVANLDLSRSRLEELLRLAWLESPEAPESATIPFERVRALVSEKFGDPNWVNRL
jgi:lipoate---protein ligase